MSNSNPVVAFNDNHVGTVTKEQYENSLVNIGLTVEQVNAVQLHNDSYMAGITKQTISYVEDNNLCTGEGDFVRVPNIYLGDLSTGNVVISPSGHTTVGITVESGEAMKLVEASISSLWESRNIAVPGEDEE